MPVPGKTFLNRKSSTALLRALLPSFVADVIWPELRPTWKIHPTSYLDGLRGIASFIVFFCHYTEQRHGYFTPTYGLNDNGEPSALIQLPYLRLLYSGRPMVHIFFVISGFVLSYKPIKLLHSGDTERCFATLASSTFRRPIRLFLPCAVSTLGIAALSQSGYIFSAAESVSAQLRNWTNVFFHKISWPWAWDTDLGPGYDIHLWTIPIEFAHSMLLFLSILGLSRMRTLLRQVANLLLILYCICSGKWAGFEFLAGLFLAEIHVLKSMRLMRGVFCFGGLGGLGGGLGKRLVSSRLLKVLLHSGILLAAMFVGGWPNSKADQTPGIRYLFTKTPSAFLGGGEVMAQKFWFGVAAVFVVWSCGELDAVRRWFEGPLAQYCGRISYAIYIMHGPGLEYFQDRVLGRPAKPAQGTPEGGDFVAAVQGFGVKGLVGVDTPSQRIMTWFVGLLILGPIMVWLSDLFWRFVDAPSVTFGRALEMACIQDDGAGNGSRSHNGASRETARPSKELGRDGYAILG